MPFRVVPLFNRIAISVFLYLPLSLVFSLQAMAQPPTASMLESLLITSMERAMEEGTPGAIIMVQTPSETHLLARGLADRSSDLAMSTDYLLRMGSVSKLYTAALIMDLIQDSLIDLNATMASYLNEQQLHRIANADTVTVRHLLNHTSGIPDYYNWQSVLFWDWEEALTPTRVLAHIRGKSPSHEAGAAYEYSNSNYHLLALIAEAVTGDSFEQLQQVRVLDPAGLDDTAYNSLHTANDQIHGYGTEFWQWSDTYKLLENTGPDGGMVATAADLTLFINALFKADGALKHLGDAMLADTVRASQRQEDGLGVELLQSRSGLTLVGHTGSVWGYMTAAGYIPSIDSTVVIYINKYDVDILNLLLRDVMIALAPTAEQSL